LLRPARAGSDRTHFSVVWDAAQNAKRRGVPFDAAEFDKTAASILRWLEKAAAEEGLKARMARVYEPFR
jgi:hypothetical protein